MTTAAQRVKIALFEQKLDGITSKLAAIEQHLETKYAQATEVALIRIEISELRKSAVTHDQFWPVKILVYGATGIILTTVLGAIAALVITR